MNPAATTGMVPIQVGYGMQEVTLKHQFAVDVVCKTHKYALMYELVPLFNFLLATNPFRAGS